MLAEHSSFGEDEARNRAVGAALPPPIELLMKGRPPTESSVDGYRLAGRADSNTDTERGHHKGS